MQLLAVTVLVHVGVACTTPEPTVPQPRQDETSAIEAIPEAFRESAERSLEGNEHALRRFILVLDVSAEQEHAIRRAHSRTRSEYLGKLTGAYGAFEAARSDFERQLASDPLFQAGANRRLPETLNDRRRLLLYRAAQRKGWPIPPDAYPASVRADVQREESRLSASLRSLKSEWDEAFSHAVVAILIDEQRGRMHTAKSSYVIGTPAGAVSGVPSEGATIPGAGIAFWFDARLLTDQRLEVRGVLPACVLAFREAFGDAAIVETPPGIVELIDRYEARWARYMRRMDDLHPDPNDTEAERAATLKLLSAHFADERPVRWSLDLQTGIYDILLARMGIEIAHMWMDATNRLLHTRVYREWSRLDAEFDESLELCAILGGNEATRQAISDLRDEYLREIDAVEEELIRASRSVAFVTRGDLTSRDTESRRALDKSIERAIHHRESFENRLAAIKSMTSSGKTRNDERASQ